MIEHDGSRVLSIKGDADDPLSRVHICPKAIALQDFHTDLSWEEAFDLKERELSQIRKDHGNDAVALYFGNPTVHHWGAMLFQKFLKQAAGTKNQFAATYSYSCYGNA